MFRNLYHEIKVHQDLKKEVLQFSVLSILYFVLYTLLSAFLGMFNHDALTVAVFWVLNLISTYVYMRFFFQMIARSRDEERMVGLKPCLRMLVIESVMFAFSVLMYYAFVCFIELYLLLALISYVYLFFCVAFQLFCFYEIYEGTGGFLKVVTSALRQMGRHGREVVAACAMLCVGYILLYVLSVGIEGTVTVLAPYTAMLNIGVTMNRWMEVCSVLLNMIMTQTFDLVYAGFLAVQLLAAVIFSILYVLWLGWICVIRQRQ